MMGQWVRWEQDFALSGLKNPWETESQDVILGYRIQPRWGCGSSSRTSR